MEVFSCRSNGLKEIFKVLGLEAGGLELSLVFGIDSNVNITKPALYTVGGSLKPLTKEGLESLGATSGIYSALAVTMLVCKFRGVWNGEVFTETNCEFYSPVKLIAEREELQVTKVSGEQYQGDVCLPIVKDVEKKIVGTLNNIFKEELTKKTFLAYRLDN